MHALLKAHMHIYILLRKQGAAGELDAERENRKTGVLCIRKRNEASIKYTHEPGLRILCFCFFFVCRLVLFVGMVSG